MGGKGLSIMTYHYGPWVAWRDSQIKAIHQIGNEGTVPAHRVKNFELAISLGFTSQPQDSPLVCFAPLGSKSPILHNKMNLIIREKKMNYGCRV
jgi:hypothetical protein